nr:hypothetical protein [Tanacetum cinerariifolium]
MDLNWYFQKTSKKIIINGSNTAGPRNQDSSRKIVVVEDTSTKAMVAIDGVGFDWSYMANDEVSINMALMAFSDSEMVQKPVLKNVEKGTVQREVRPAWNNAMRTNHQNFSNSRRKFAPTAVLTKSGIVPINTGRQSSSSAATPVIATRPINIDASKPLANSVNTAKANFVNTVKGNKVISDVGKQRINAVKSSACWVQRPKVKVQNHVSKNSGSYICKRFDYGAPQDALKDQGYFDSGCFGHMTRNISYLTDFKEHDEGYFAFRGGAKGGKITGKGTIRIVKYALTVSPTIHTSCIKQFWTSAKVKTVNDEVWIQALVDGKRVNIKESSIRRILRLEDADDTSCLTNAEVFEAPEEVGILQANAQPIPIPTEPSTSKPQKKHKPKRKPTQEPKVPPSVSPAEHNLPLPSHDPLPSGEDSMKFKELMDFCTNLSNKVLDLESEVIDTKSTCYYCWG